LSLLFKGVFQSRSNPLLFPEIDLRIVLGAGVGGGGGSGGGGGGGCLWLIGRRHMGQFTSRFRTFTKYSKSGADNDMEILASQTFRAVSFHTECAAKRSIWANTDMGKRAVFVSAFDSLEMAAMRCVVRSRIVRKGTVSTLRTFLLRARN
jgi:hypothetical protein